MSKFFFASCAGLVAVLALVFYLDYNREWKPYELAYYNHYHSQEYEKNHVLAVQQLTPKNAQETERCITCHVPDIAVVGGKVAAQRIPLIMPPTQRSPVAHPSQVTPEMVKTYGLPSQYAGLSIDETGCMVCHNGQALATEVDGAHRNLIVNLFDVVDRGGVIFKNNCAQCHGNNGEGGIGPPLNDQHRLGFFNDDYYYDCVFYGHLSEHHLHTVMPPWGAQNLLDRNPTVNNEKVSLMVHWIRHYQQPLTFNATP